jgi:cytochrome P450
MPVLQAVLYESMRLYPPAPLVARECMQDGVVLEDGAGPGLRLCKGTTVIIPIASIHRDPELWQAPEAFDPGRWRLAAEEGEGGAPLRASGTASLRHPLAYMPFSAGTRNCIGSHFALLEARVILATLCSRVDWAVGEGYVHQPVMAVTLRPSKGLPMRFSEI